MFVSTNRLFLLFQLPPTETCVADLNGLHCHRRYLVRFCSHWLRGSVLDGTWSVEDPQTEQYVSAILKARMQGFMIIFIITVPLRALCLGASFLVDDIVLRCDVDRSGDQGAAMTTEPARDIKKG